MENKEKKAWKPYFNGKSRKQHQIDVKKEQKKVEYYIHINGLQGLRSYDLYT